jgi:hypothetical protein
MSIDLTAETTLTLTAAAKLVPPGHGGKKTHISTLLRWILDGVRSPSGEKVRLEGARLGSRWITSKEALQRFMDRLTPVVSDRTPPATPRTPTQRQRAAKRAGEELDKIGI